MENLLNMWRFKLPCGHHTFYPTTKSHNPNECVKGYRCGQCGKVSPYKIDKKNNERVKP